MRNTPNLKAEKFRVRTGEEQSFSTDGNNGRFRVEYHIPATGGRYKLLCIVSDGMGWDHVSVSVPGAYRCPTWEEMCSIKELFFRDDETVIQFHPTKDQYVNDHPHCLHLWRKQGLTHELPPSIVGFTVKEEKVAS